MSKFKSSDFFKIKDQKIIDACCTQFGLEYSYFEQNIFKALATCDGPPKDEWVLFKSHSMLKDVPGFGVQFYGMPISQGNINEYEKRNNLLVNEVKEGQFVFWINTKFIELVNKINQIPKIDGCTCTRCKNFSPMSEPNFPNNIFLCYSCNIPMNRLILELE